MINSEIDIEKTKHELILIVDEDDNIIGTNTRKEMDIVVVLYSSKIKSNSFILNRNGKYLVQKRSMQKEYCPGFLDLAFGGIVAAGEEDSIAESAERELNEELGLNIKELNLKYENLELKFNGKFFFKDNVTIEWGYIFLLELPSIIESEIKFSDGEVEYVEWLSYNEIIEKIKNHDKITADSISIFHFINEQTC